MKEKYYKGIAWIASNDEPEETEVEFVKYQVSVILLADIFNKDPEEVARAIVRLRTQT